jgi:hypothetical protein
MPKIAKCSIQECPNTIREKCLINKLMLKPGWLHVGKQAQ